MSKSDTQRLKEFISAEQAIGKTVSKIVWGPKVPLFEHRAPSGDGILGGVSVAIHFTDGTVTTFSFGEDWTGCYYVGEDPNHWGVNIEDEGELAACEESADELELWSD